MSSSPHGEGAVDLAADVTSSLNDALGIAVVVTDGVRPIAVNASACRLVGRRLEEMLELASVAELLAPDERLRLGGELTTPPAVGHQPVARRTRAARKDGVEVDVDMVVSRVTHGGQERTIVVLRDLSEIEMLRHMAMTDPLTGLANRRVLQDRIDNLLFRARREPRDSVLFYIDLDDFKAINDEHGHMAGDAVLVEVGRRLRQNKRRYDLVARLGGDEFAVLIERIPDPLVLEGLAERMAETFVEPHVVAGTSRHVGASIGWYAFDGSAPDAEHILRRADDAMYRRKNLRTS